MMCFWREINKGKHVQTMLYLKNFKRRGYFSKYPFILFLFENYLTRAMIPLVVHFESKLS